jgi:hypothetical protein
MSSIDQQITSTYQPVLDNLTQQSKLVNDRYAQNKADITNIFGKLSSLSAADAARINDQFVKTIADQQAGLAQRTAEVRAQQQTAAQGQQQVGADRGNGPMGGPSQVDVTAQQGINRSNEYQTTWEALMNANKMQAQQDASNTTMGYGQQQQTAMTALQRNLENKLAEIGGNTAAVQSDIAKAKISAQQNLMGLQYQAQNDAANRENAKAVAQIRAGGAVTAAQIAASSKALGQPKTIDDWMSSAEKLGKGMSTLVMGDVGLIYSRLKAAADAKTKSGVNNAAVTVTKAQLMAAYLAAHKGENGTAAGITYIDQFSGLK